MVWAVRILIDLALACWLAFKFVLLLFSQEWLLHLNEFRYTILPYKWLRNILRQFLLFKFSLELHLFYYVLSPLLFLLLLNCFQSLFKFQLFDLLSLLILHYLQLLQLKVLQSLFAVLSDSTKLLFILFHFISGVFTLLHASKRLKRCLGRHLKYLLLWLPIASWTVTLLIFVLASWQLQ